MSDPKDEKNTDGRALREDEMLDPKSVPEISSMSNEAGNVIRPQSFVDYIGQRKQIENLEVFIKAAKKRDDVLDHVLLWAPPGLGKTTLAHIIANELDVEIFPTSGPAIPHKGDLAGMLTNLKRGDILFIDEIHRLSRVIEENLYPAMEDFQFDIIVGEGAHANSVKLSLQQFTLIGATTRAGLLSNPLKDRFGINIELDFYDPEDLVKIVRRTATIFGFPIEDKAAFEIATRSRGTPRIANHLLKRIRDFAQIADEQTITLDVTRYGLAKLEIDEKGLDKIDRRILKSIIRKFSGGPVGLSTLCAALSMETDTLEEAYEPYLIQQGYLQRTPKGRIATLRAYEHLEIKPPTSQFDLFSSDFDKKED